MIFCRPLSDAEKRLHEAAENGKCDAIKALAEVGTDLSCPDPDYVRKRLIHELFMCREVGWSTDRPAPENDHHATRDVNGNFSAVMAVLGTVSITPTHCNYIHRPCLHNRWVAMWARAAEHIMCRIG